MGYDFTLVDVFTDRAFGGNQLAVLTDARGLSGRQMQAIAREFNFAETSFVLPPEDPRHACRLRIFSPGAEMPFAGHPTVGTAAVLVDQQLVRATQGAADFVVEENVGPVRVVVRTDSHAVHSQLVLSASLDEPGGAPDTTAIAECLGLAGDRVVGTWFGSVGLRFCFAQLASAADVDAAVLDRSRWADVLRGAWSEQLFIFAGDLKDGNDVYARMFAPAIGVDEDPATGSAVAALAGRAASRSQLIDGDVELTVRQGVKIGRPSTIECGGTMTSGSLTQVSVGGYVTIVGRGVLSIDGDSGA